MLSDYRVQALIGVWGGFFFCFFGYFVSRLSNPTYMVFGYVMLLGGYLLLASGGYMYARGKGYSRLVGILGVLGPVGLLLLYVLRDRSAVVLKRRRRDGVL